MKNKLSLITTLLFIPTILTACPNSGKKYASKVTNYEKVMATTYMYMPGMPGSRMDFADLIPEGETKTSIEMFNNIKIAYISVDDFVSEYLNARADFGGIKYETTYNGYKAKVYNPVTKATCTIDFKTGRVTFSSHMGFFTGSTAAGCDGDYISSALDNQLFKGVHIYSFTPGHRDSSIDLNKYNIKGYFYEGKGYLPLNFITFLLSNTNPALINGIIYNGKDVYSLSGSNDQSYIEYTQTIRSEATNLNKEYMELNYNCLAFLIDNHYGMKKRFLRTNQQYKNYIEGGAYEILKPYKDRLLSLADNVYDTAVAELFANELDDGGHSHYGPYSLTRTDVNAGFTTMKQREYTINVMDTLSEARANAKYGIKDYFDNEEAKGYYSEIDDVAFLTFDEFAVDPMLEYNPEKYYKDTISLVRYANEQIKSKNIKNVVFDLSVNGGGAVVAEEFIESWSCGGSFHSKEFDTRDGSICEVSKHADVNGDGEFNEKDYLGSDVNLYAILSPSSFSCGNLFPTKLKERSDCKFIGDRSGGGCCTVEGMRFLPMGGVISISSFFNSLLDSSDEENPVTNDDGIIPEFYSIPYSKENASKYYDRQTIVNKIHNK